ncbi:hypothetical protein EV702DRAFT_515891, partial [Suillus placidus]
MPTKHIKSHTKVQHTRAQALIHALRSSLTSTTKHFCNMSITIPTGSYIIMNATTHTYLNVFNFQVVPGDIVNSVGNRLGNDIVRILRLYCMLLQGVWLYPSQWNVANTESCGVTIQSFGTGAFLSFDQSNKYDTPAGSVVTSHSIYPWSLQQNTAVPYAWNIVDKNTRKALAVHNDSIANGAQVLEVENLNNPSQAWLFIAKEPIPGTN